MFHKLDLKLENFDIVLFIYFKKIELISLFKVCL